MDMPALVFYSHGFGMKAREVVNNAGRLLTAIPHLVRVA
jgi:hypothetical protein